MAVPALRSLRVMQPYYRDLTHGITVIDTGYHRAGFDASYLLTAGDEAAFIDVGTALSVPRLLQVLASKNIGRVCVCFLDTPGHARHHYSVYDETSNGVFAGDVFGLSYREFDSVHGPFIFPTTTPVQFEPAAMHASIDRLLGLAPQHIYLTHYGRIDASARLAARLHDLIEQYVALARAVAGAGAARHRSLTEGLTRLLWRAVQAHGCTMSYERAVELLAVDIDLNAQGLAVWLDKQYRQPQ